MGMYTNKPPAAVAAEKQMKLDPPSIPCYREWVSFIVVADDSRRSKTRNEEGKKRITCKRLIDLVVSP